MKKIKGQNFQVVFSPKEKWIMFAWGRISPEEKGTKFPSRKMDEVPLRTKDYVPLGN